MEAASPLDNRQIQLLIGIKMVMAGYTSRGLAKVAGISHHTVDSLRCGRLRSATGRRRVELVLGPIWSTAEEFSQQRERKLFLGCDPILSEPAVLKAALRARGIDLPFKNRAARLAAIDQEISKMNNTPVNLDRGN